MDIHITIGILWSYSPIQSRRDLKSKYAMAEQPPSKYICFGRMEEGYQGTKGIDDICQERGEVLYHGL